MADIYNKQQIQPGAPASTVAGQGIGGSNKPGTGRFGDLQNYIKANQKADTAEKLGKNINNQASAVGQAVGESKQQFQQQAGQEQQRLSQFGDLQTQIKGGQELQDPQYQQFAQYRQGTFQKPEIQNAQQLQDQQAALQNKAGMAASEQGRFQLLKDVFGRPTYNTGQQRLDQLILQAGPNQLKNLQQTSRQAAQQGQQALTGFQSEAAAQQAAIAQQAQDVQNQAKGLVTGETQNLRGEVEGREQQLEGQTRESYNLLKQIIEAQKQGGPPASGNQIQALPQGPQINEDQYNRLLQTLGGSAETQLYGALKGADPSSFLNEAAIDRDTSAFANEQNLNRFSQLQKLAGEDASLLGGFNLRKTDAYDPTKIFNADQLNRMTQQQEAMYRSDLGNKESRYNDLKTIAGEVAAGAGDERTRQLLSSNLANLLGSPVQGQIDRGVLGQINAYGSRNFGGEDLDEVRRALSQQQAWGGEALSGNRDYLQPYNWMSGQTPTLSEGAIAARDADIQKALAGVTKRRQSMADEAQAQMKAVQDKYGYGESLASLLGKYKV